jgi:PAS domain S-box-containing protein
MKNIDKKTFLRKDLLESLVDSLALGVSVFDRSGKIIFSNPHWHTLVGKHQSSKYDQFIGAGGQKQKSQHLKNKVGQAIRHGKVSEIHNFFYRPATKGTSRYFDIIIGPLRDKNGKIIGAYSTAKNVTTRNLARKKLLKLKALLEKKVLERTEKLERANLKLKELSEERSFLVSDIAHEIKTILTVIRGNMEILKLSQRATEPLEMESYREIMKEIERMSRIASDLVFIAKTKEYAAMFNFEKTNICKILEELVANYKNVVKDSMEIVLNIKSRQCHDFSLKADKEKMKTLFGNLIDNAIKFRREENKSKIWISASAKDGVMEISFRDNGVGIPKEKIPYLFSPFFQVDKSRSSMSSYRKSSEIKIERGYGLGLAICKKIAAAHNGKIRVESGGQNKGATFVVCLPVA